MTQPAQFSRDGHRVDVRRDDSGRAVCGAKTRNGGGCKKSPIVGRMRCRNHGGLTPVGRASPQYRHGRQSRYRTLLGLDELRDNDLEMMDMRIPIQVTEEVLSKLTERMKDNDSPAFRAECKLRFGRLRAVMLDPTSTPGQISGALNFLGAWIDRGKREDSALTAIQASAEKLSTQIKRGWDVHTSATHSLNKGEAQDFFRSIVVLVTEECGSEASTRVLRRAMRELLGHGDDNRALPVAHTTETPE